MPDTSIPHLQSLDNLTNDISTPVLSGKNALRAVFKDHFNELPGLNLRPVVIKEIEKMINCQNPDSGTYYCCTSCNYQLFVPFTCKSRFCPSCGTMINKQRCVAISNHILDVMHRQWVFTIPKDLWPYFKDNWDLINYLFDAASETIRFVTKRICPDLVVEPGFIGVLHTFGRSDKDFEPHIHFVVTAGGITKYGKWFEIKRYPYELVRKTFQKKVLSKLSLPSALGYKFRPVADEMYKKYPNGFVVNLPLPEDHLKDDLKKIVKYIARYIARPCIASGRIDAYDGEKISYHYTPHESNESVPCTVTAIEFIQMLAQHIPDENFRILRYYGIYNNSNHKAVERVNKAIGIKQVDYLYAPENKEYREYFSHWEGSMIHTFNVDPLDCPECGTRDMVALFAKYNGKTYYAPNVKPKYQGPPPKLVQRKIPTCPK